VNARLRTLAIASVVVIALLVALYGKNLMPVFQDQGHIEVWLSRWGALAPVGLVALQAAQVILAPIPGQVLGLASGYLFGPVAGTLYSLLGTGIGSLIAFALARRYGRPLVERSVSPSRLARFDAGARRRGLLFFVLIFLLPFLPDDLACFAAGLTRIPIAALMLAALAGRAPGLLVSAWLGARAGALSANQWAALVAASMVLAALFVAYGERVQDKMLRLLGGR
jgi:uncharacterized membrane protein YdjX (TVP38/TMEM64 family)